jgi:Cytochrome oxidase maturation protein cbb3-type
MNMLMILMPVALALGALGLWAFLWNLNQANTRTLRVPPIAFWGMPTKV